MRRFGIPFPVKRHFAPMFKLPVHISKQKTFLTELDAKQTVKMFVEALALGRNDDALSHISKTFVQDFDLDELSEIFYEMKFYKFLIPISSKLVPSHCMTNSILIMHEKHEMDSVVHLHLMRELDGSSAWKIYGLVKE